MIRVMNVMTVIIMIITLIIMNITMMIRMGGAEAAAELEMEENMQSVGG